MTFLWSKLAQSVVKRTLQATVAFLSGPSVAGVLQGWGVTTDAQTGFVTISLFGVIEALRNVLKHRFNLKWL